jgi:hypothetical protein
MMHSVGKFKITEEFLLDGTFTVVLNKLKEDQFSLLSITRVNDSPKTFTVYGIGPMFDEAPEGCIPPEYDVLCKNPVYDSAHVLVDLEIEVSRA